MPNMLDFLESQTQAPIVFNCFNTLLRAVGLEYLLEGYHPLTIFAPVDRAFETYGGGGVYDLEKDLHMLTFLLKYHLVPLALSTDDILTLALENTRANQVVKEPLTLQLPTYTNQVITAHVDKASKHFTVNGYRVPRADIRIGNGVIHILDNVLWPQGLDFEAFGTRSPASIRTQ